jgi:hypothetical protein
MVVAVELVLAEAHGGAAALAARLPAEELADPALRFGMETHRCSSCERFPGLSLQVVGQPGNGLLASTRLFAGWRVRGSEVIGGEGPPPQAV